MNNKNLFLFFFMVLGVSCSDNQEQVVSEEQLPYIINFEELEFTDEPQPISDFVDSIEYIRLADEPLLEEANSMMDLYVTEEEDFCITRKLHYTFDKNGKFNKSLYRIGQGPGEVVQALDRPIYNLKGNDITIWNYGVGYSKFDRDNGFIEKFSSIDSTRQEKKLVAYIGDKEVFFYFLLRPQRGDLFNLDGPVQWYVKDTSTDSIVYTKENPFFHIKAHYRGSATTIDYPLSYSHIDSTLWIRHIFQDTLFQTRDGLQWEPWYVIKRHASDYDYKELMQLTLLERNPKEIMKGRMLDKFYPLPTGVIFSYSNLKTTFFGFCKNNESARTASENSFKNDLDDHLKKISIDNVPVFQRNGYLYLLIDAYKFFEDGCTPPFTDLVEDSNPVVVKLKLKKE